MRPVSALVQPFPVSGSLILADRVAVVSRHLVIPERPAPDIDPSDQARRHPPALGTTRADEKLGVGWEIDMPAARPPADELAVDVEREGVLVPGRGHLVPLARVPFRDRDADAGVRCFGIRRFEAQEVDALREPQPVAELDESRVVLVAALPAGLHPEGDAAA